MSYRQAQKNALFAKIQIERLERFIAQLTDIKETYITSLFYTVGTHVEDEKIAQVFLMHFIQRLNGDDIAKELNIERRTVDLILKRLYNIFAVGN